MSYRSFGITTNSIYHVYNRAVDKQTIFHSEKDYYRFLSSIAFYRYNNGPISKLYNLKQPKTVYYEILKKPILTYKNLKIDEKVTVITFCTMPNHYHLLLLQKRDNGISDFIKQLQQSYSQYYNLKNDRVGTLWQNRFKASPVESIEYLRRLVKYTHTNPINSSKISLAKTNELINYKYCSHFEYATNPTHRLSDDSLIINKDFTIDKYNKYLITKEEDDPEFVREIEKYKKI